MALVAGLLAFGCAAQVDLPTDADENQDAVYGGQSNGNASVVLVRNIHGSACTGVLFAPDYVLTAGHCRGWDPGPKQGFSTIGVVSNAGFFNYNVRSALSMNDGVGRDFAVLRLSNAVPAHVATPAVLAPRGYAVNPGDHVLPVGWGTDQFGQVHKRRSEYRAAVWTTSYQGGDIFSPTRNAHFRYQAISANTETCGGDSGGPIWHGWVVAGVTTHVPGGSRCDGVGDRLAYATDVGRMRDIIDWFHFVLATNG